MTIFIARFCILGIFVISIGSIVIAAISVHWRVIAHANIFIIERATFNSRIDVSEILRITN
jgi:hypothetical protein